jgi:hypothetical protein
MEGEWVMPRGDESSGFGCSIRPPFACGFGETALPCIFPAPRRWRLTGIEIHPNHRLIHNLTILFLFSFGAGIALWVN